MLVTLAKLGNPVMVGQLALALAVTTPVFTFSNLQLSNIQATDARYEYLFGDYLGLRIITTVLALLVTLGTTLLVKYHPETTLIIMVVGITRAFASISDVYYGLLQQHERMDRIAKSMIIEGLLSLIMLGAGVYFTGSMLWGVIGSATAQVLVLVGYDIRSGSLVLKTMARTSGDESISRADPAIELRPHWSIEALWKLAWLALPLGFVAMLSSLYTNIPRYFIEHYLGERELGIFAAMAYLIIGGSTVANALGQSTRPRLAKYYAAGNSKAFRTLLLKLVGVGILLGTVGVLAALIAGREILILLYRPEYANHASVLIWLMVAAGIGYVGSSLGNGILATRAFSRYIIPHLVVVAGIIGFSALLIPAYGLIGAAWALCAVSLVGLVAIIVILKTMRRQAITLS